MAWSYDRARERIHEAVATIPQIRVETFDVYLPRVRALNETRGEAPQADMVRDLGRGDAVLVDTVQVYVNVINYNDMRLEAGRESEASHGRALSFLHVHYAALDRASDGAGAQRIDFHGPRMHTVFPVAVPDDGGYQEAVRQALRLARETVELSAAGSRDIVRSQVQPQFRIGIDIGRCVAVDSGRKGEREPLFIGSAANHAAKLAEGDQPGIYLSDRVRALFGQMRVGGLAFERRSVLSGADASRLLRDGFAEDAARVSRKIEAMREDLRAHRDATIGSDGFVFHPQTLPLRGIDYAALRPSNSVRMPMASIFADLDGYTAYVDRAVASGGVGDAVRDLHVIRGELNAVLQDDFKGRKVRFIGDCLHGLIATGEGNQTHLARTVDLATACAGGIRSSFDLCLEHLPTANGLGLAIGCEVGPTPVSRIGIRGERSVRVASSVATLVSEQIQRDCDGRQTRLGPEALRHASSETKRLFDGQGVGTDLDYDAVALQSAVAATAAGGVQEPVAEGRHYAA